MHRHRDRENYNAPVRGKWAKIVFFGISFLAGFSIHTQNATAESLSQKDQTNMAMEKIAAKYVQKIATYPPILPMTEISDALRQQLDAEFNAAIKELAEKRLATRANEIDATPIFQKIITRHSVEVLHHYLSKRYGLERETDGGGNNDLQQWSYGAILQRLWTIDSTDMTN